MLKKYRIAFLLVVALCLNALLAQSQPVNGWELFKKVEFQKKFFKDYGMFVTWPKFDDGIRAWEGREILLSGYIIPTSDAGGYKGVILSKFPYQTCFFCGEAGIESVAELELKNKWSDYDLNKPYVFKGKLQLNDDNMDRLNFILKEAVLTDL